LAVILSDSAAAEWSSSSDPSGPASWAIGNAHESPWRAARRRREE